MFTPGLGLARAGVTLGTRAAFSPVGIHAGVKVAEAAKTVVDKTVDLAKAAKDKVDDVAKGLADKGRSLAANPHATTQKATDFAVSATPGIPEPSYAGIAGWFFGLVANPSEWFR
jgi:hypothetical protein